VSITNPNELNPDSTAPYANPDPLLPVRAAAEYLGLKEWHVGELLRTGTIPSVRLGRALRVRVSALEAYIAANTQAGR
jgi:excisionase family DNA binding protein